MRVENAIEQHIVFKRYEDPRFHQFVMGAAMGLRHLFEKIEFSQEQLPSEILFEDVLMDSNLKTKDQFAEIFGDLNRIGLYRVFAKCQNIARDVELDFFKIDLAIGSALESLVRPDFRQ